ncbi:MAG TPA: M20/M25/M40 family metallo-hydrolase [Thermoanaerobaculia bacterium]|jgi:acetylornithine deacetylase/succinyl-diaminopimelate desuccinylase-like protein|nr:M20/M25/M40 family metallo-hydrolase [Thermoanaerobaculia bacterium]
MRLIAVLLCALPLFAADQKAVLRELVDLLAIPNLADDTANINANATKLQAMLERRGLATRLLTLDGAPPIVVGDWKAEGSTRTLAFYAHYDGQPLDPAQWKSAPWTPVMRDANGNDVDWTNATALDPEWRLYARSASDDKAPIMAMLAAVDSLRARNVKPRVNLRFVFEGEEEAGSPHLAAYIAKYPDVLRPDAWIICDGPVHQSRRAQLAFGARGVLTLDLVVYGPVRALHDGHYGNWVPNPIVALTHLLASMRDENGRILIDGFYDNVVVATTAEKAAVAAMPPVEDDLRREFQIARTEGVSLNERILLPALNVSGIQSGGVGDKASNTLQISARAAIDFRLVPAQTPDSVKAHVERHLAARGYKIVRDDPDAATRLANDRIVRVRWGSGYPPARTPLDHPLAKEIAALMTRAGHEPVRLPTMGGSVPIYLFQQPDNTPTIVLPIVNHDNNQHAANENLRLRNLWDGIAIFTALFEGLEKGGR